MERVVIALITLVTVAAIVWPAARICRRTGYSPWLALAAVVLLANIVLLCFIAFAPWKTDRTDTGHPRPSLRGVPAFLHLLREKISSPAESVGY